MKRKIRLTESQLHNIIRESIKSVLNEGRRTFLQKKYDRWANTNQIPKTVMNMVRHITQKVGYPIEEEEVIAIRNYYGEIYAYAKGFRVTYCTSSYANGPSEDYSQAILKWLKGLDFEIVGEGGDNGLDSATNYHDTYWTYDVIYKPSLIYAEQFEKYEENENDDY